MRLKSQTDATILTIAGMRREEFMTFPKKLASREAHKALSTPRINFLRM